VAGTQPTGAAAPGIRGAGTSNMTDFNRIRVLLLAVPAVFLAAACSSTASVDTSSAPPAPTGGWLTVELTTPRNDDGAVQFAVTGPEIDSVKVVGFDGFGVVNGAEADFVVTGNVTSGIVGRVYVSDLSHVSLYQATIAAAAARNTFQLQSLDGYRAVLVR